MKSLRKTSRSRWEKVAKQVAARANYLCEQCDKRGKTTVGNQADHIIPISKGGTDDMENLQWLCDDCHRVKTAMDQGYKVKGCDAGGVPVDPGHHWNS